MRLAFTYKDERHPAKKFMLVAKKQLHVVFDWHRHLPWPQTHQVIAACFRGLSAMIRLSNYSSRPLQCRPIAQPRNR